MYGLEKFHSIYDHETLKVTVNVPAAVVAQKVDEKRPKSAKKDDKPKPKEEKGKKEKEKEQKKREKKEGTYLPYFLKWSAT